MQPPDDAQTPNENAARSVFLDAGHLYNTPGRIVTLGHYYPQRQGTAVESLLREPRSIYTVKEPPIHSGIVRRNLGWTKLIAALNADRRWPRKRLIDLLDPMLKPDIAIAVVPTHMAYQAFWPLRALARELAEKGRVDATSCLVRHTTVKRITFGGPSTRQLHRQTIRIENQDLIAGRPVLLLDDIAKSGASLIACREMLLDAGAAVVQAMALGRVISGGAEQG